MMSRLLGVRSRHGPCEKAASCLLALLGSISISLAWAGPRADATWHEALAGIDPSREASFVYFDRESRIEPESWLERLQWSIDGDVAYGFDAAVHASTSGRVTVPLTAFTRAAERAERDRVRSRLAALERDSIEREYTYSVLDLMCRMGYLRAVLSASERMVDPARAAGAGTASDPWTLRRHNARSELAAIASQVRSYSPAAADLTDVLGAFSCRLPGLPAGPVFDGIDTHPRLETLALEAAQQRYQAAFASDLGGPELTLRGSVRHTFASGDTMADISLTASIPFSYAGSSGTVMVGADDHEARVSVRVDSSHRAEHPGQTFDLAASLEIERATLSYQLARADATLGILRFQTDKLWHQLGLQPGVADPSCVGMCRVAVADNVSIGGLELYLEALGASYELARAQLDLMRIMALDPATLADRNALGFGGSGTDARMDDTRWR